MHNEGKTAMSKDRREWYDDDGNAICPICRERHRASEHPTEPDYIVVRPGEGLPEGFLPPDMDGRWYNRADIPQRRSDNQPPLGGMTVSEAVAVPTDRFEVRDDGAVAQVWEVRP